MHTRLNTNTNDYHFKYFKITNFSSQRHNTMIKIQLAVSQFCFLDGGIFSSQTRILGTEQPLASETRTLGNSLTRTMCAKRAAD